MTRDLDEFEEIEDESNFDTSTEFRQEFDTLDSHEKGSWGELAVIKEADEEGHVILLQHWDEPTARGFDCASMDPETGELHIWEMKNWGSRAVGVNDLTAWQDQKEGEPREGYKNNWEDVIKAAPEGAVRDRIQQAINDGNVTYHLRLGPETEITSELQKELEDANVPGTKYDWKRYQTLT